MTPQEFEAWRADLLRRQQPRRSWLVWVLHLLIWASVAGATWVYLDSVDRLAEFRETGVRR